jgi:biotin carboxyl carrier protein
MNKLSKSVLTIFALAILFSCTQQTKERAELVSKAQVRITGITKGYLPNYIELSGKTIYLNKSNLVAPIGGYITKVNVRQGDWVKRGDLLFGMQSPEAYAMKGDAKYGFIEIKAPTTGQLVSLSIVNTGIFAEKGAAMCTILSSDDLMLQVNVPFEYKKYSKIGNKCEVIFPDNTVVTGKFTNILSQVDKVSQTIKALAKLRTKLFIPENIIVKVLLDKSTKQEHQILAKECVQTDALMSHFWVMKLINDTTTVKIPIKIGNKTHKQVEILSPEFEAGAQFIREGGYGLGDTTIIEILN